MDVDASAEFKNGRYAQGQFEPIMSEAGACKDLHILPASIAVVDFTKGIGILGTITDVSDQRQFEQARVAHAEERELLARRQMEEAETRRQEADERRRAQGSNFILSTCNMSDSFFE